MGLDKLLDNAKLKEMLVEIDNYISMPANNIYIYKVDGIDYCTYKGECKFQNFEDDYDIKCMKRYKISKNKHL